MTQPLAIVVYEKLLPGTQLVNRLQDLNYRVQSITDVESLVACAQQERPMLVIADLVAAHHNICAFIGQLRQNPSTRHIPVVAFAPEDAVELKANARAAGAILVVNETAIVSHLSQFLEQALRVE